MKERFQQQEPHDPSKCMKHKQPVTVYCDEPDCQVMLCPTCIHRNHNIVDIREKAEEVRKQLEELRENSLELEDVIDEQIETSVEIKEKINATASKALDELEERRFMLQQQVNDSIEHFKAEVVQNQKKHVKEINEVIERAKKRRAGIEEFHQLTDQYMDQENLNDVVENSKIIIENYNKSVVTNKLECTTSTYELTSFSPETHDNFNEQVIGKLIKTVEHIHMPGHIAERMPQEGILNTSWPVNGHTVTCGPTGDIYAVITENNVHYLKAFDLQGNVKMCIDLGLGIWEVRGLAYAMIEEMSTIVLTTYNAIQIRHSQNGQLIDSLPIKWFEPSFNAICITSTDSILVCDDSYSAPSKIVEFQVNSIKIMETKKCLKIPLSYVRGLCQVLHDYTELVIASSTNQAIVAIDYHSGDVLWRIDQPVCEGTIIGIYICFFPFVLKEWEIGRQH